MHNSALHLEQLRAAFGSEAGVLPDAWVIDSSEEDWPNLLTAFARAGWPHRWNSTGRTPLLGELDDPEYLGQSIAVWPTPGVQLNFFVEDNVVFDLDLRELQDQAAVDALCEAIDFIGTALGKSVEISEEGDRASVVVKFDHRTRRFALQSADPEA